MTASSAWKVESIQNMKTGTGIRMAGYEFKLEDVKRVRGPNYMATRGIFAVSKPNSDKIIMKPEKRIYAVPPFTKVKSLDFDDHPFTIESWEESCALCGSSNSFLDEVITDDEGTRMFVCSDSNFCKEQIEKLTNAPLVQNGDGS